MCCSARTMDVIGPDGHQSPHAGFDFHRFDCDQGCLPFHGSQWISFDGLAVMQGQGMIGRVHPTEKCICAISKLIGILTSTGARQLPRTQKYLVRAERGLLGGRAKKHETEKDHGMHVRHLPCCFRPRSAGAQSTTKQYSRAPLRSFWSAERLQPSERTEAPRIMGWLQNGMAAATTRPILLRSRQSEQL
jgi:hypothetical protein